MKHLIYMLAIQIFSMTFLQGGIFGEMGRIPLLIAHLDAHRSTEPDLSLMTFLSDHYLSLTHEHQGKQHDSLPFQLRVSSSCIYLFFQIPRMEYSSLIFPEILLFNSIEYLSVPINISSSVFHPPQRLRQIAL